jgi:hypothetical protein
MKIPTELSDKRIGIRQDSTVGRIESKRKADQPMDPIGQSNNPHEKRRATEHPRGHIFQKFNKTSENGHARVVQRMMIYD